MSSSRRRKPLVTSRKPLSDEEESNDDDSKMTNGDVSDVQNNEDIPEDLPEGTVIVEPEAVEETTFKGPEFPSSKKKVLEATGYLATVYCSACGEQINTSKKGDARRHPELSVLICKRCYKFHTSGPIEQDEDGLDEHCRWCSEGGNLFGCDYCHNAFCQSCIKRNLGRAEFSKVKEADKFKCYVCNPAPLAAMVEQCNSVIDNIEKEFQKLTESAKKKKEVEKQKSSSKSDDKEKHKPSSNDKDKSNTDTDKSKSLIVKLPGLGNKLPKTSTPKSKESVGSILRPAVPSFSQTSKPSILSSIVRQPIVSQGRPFSSMLQQHANTSKQNVIYVEPQKGSAKQLVYVQPKPHQVNILNNPTKPGQQVREPLHWTNVTVRNVPFVTDQLITSANELLTLLRSVRMNVQGPGNSLSSIAMEGRKTAISCMQSGVDLFLGQLSSIVGTNIVQSSKDLAATVTNNKPDMSSVVKVTGGNSSVISASEKDLIVLDSENDDSKAEIVDVTDSSDKTKDTPNENNTDKDKSGKESSTDKIEKNMEKAEEDSEKKSDKTENDEAGEEKRSESVNEESDTEMTEAENDAAHLELLQELQELSGTTEVKSDDKSKGDKSIDKDNNLDKKEKVENKNGEKPDDKKEKKDNKRDEKLNDTKEKKNDKKDGKKDNKNDEKSDKKDEKENDESSEDSSSSESDYEDESSDNSKKDSDYDIKTERRSRRAQKKEEEKNKFKELRKKRKKMERSAKKKKKEESKIKKEKEETEEKSKKGKKKKGVSDESDFDDELEDEIEKLEKTPVLRKGKKKEEEKKETDKKSGKDAKDKDKKSGKNEKDRNKKSKNDEKKESNLDDLSSTEEDNVEDDDNEDEDVPMEQDNDDDDTETIDLSGKENEEEDVVDDSSDSEIILSPRKKKALEKKKADKKKGTKESGSDTEEDSAPKKKRLRSSLLDAKLSDSESDFQPLKKKQKGKKRKADSSAEGDSNKSSDSEQEFIALGKKSKNKGNKKKKEGTGKRRKRIKKVASSSEGDEEDQTEAESDELEEMKKKKKRRRKKKGESDSEEEKDEDDEDGSPSKGKRKDIRKLITTKKLKEETKAASKAEEERRERIAAKQKKYNNIVQEIDESSPTKAPITKQLILERDEDGKEPILEVDHELVVKLKPHQVEAVEFMWNCTIESLKMLKEDKVEGNGCILAHCMGLGKTLSVIAYLHTMLGNYETTQFATALIVCPLNTVLNWQNEVNIWLEDNDVQLQVFELASVKVNETRAKLLDEWHEDGGIMIIGYEMFRNLSQGSNCRSKKLKTIFTKTLVDPGPDFVVCDEGHILKNDSSALSKAMNTIKTKRRIVLTGTPLQNNLVEYHCMVNFVKPNLLGTRKEFLNRFVNPITNGQCTDSSAHDVRLMKRRAHILHEKLAGCVQRKDYSALTKYLPPKHEYVIAVRLANVQCDLYNKYLELGGFGGGEQIKSKGAKLFSDYQALMRIWTHPWVLKMNEIRQEMKNMFDDEESFIDDSTSSSGSESEAKSSGGSGSNSDDITYADSDSDNGKKKKKQKGKEKDKKEEEEPVKESFAGEIVKKWKTRSRGEFNEGDFEPMEEEKKPFSEGWWAEYVKEEDEFKIELSGKLTLLFEILRMCEEIGDKVLIFSQSLLSLDLIEAFLEHIDKEHDEALNKDKDSDEKDKDKDEKDKKDKDKKDKKDKDKDKKDKDKDKKDNDKEDKDDSQKPEDIPVEEIFGKRWLQGQDYLRMDGSTGAPQRAAMAKNFNDPENYRLRLFLISTKAGGLGINLVGANRVIIFDASWNPSHDVQSIFRVYRFGQEKPVYVYRFLAQGTMEEKIYERQVTKQSLSQRVIDEHQIDRHFNSNDLRELYIFKPDRLDDPNREERPTPALPKDTLLAELLTDKKDWIVGYHEHDSLLENKTDQELSEEERKAAWEEFENERKGLISTVQRTFMGQMPNNMNFPQQFGGFGNPNMGMGMGMMTPQLNQENLLRIVQEMKQKFPHLPQEQLTMQVQNVIRNMISRQIQQQQFEQRRQIEQRELQQQKQLQQIQARIMQQQNQLRIQQSSPQSLGMNMSIGSLGSMQRPNTSMLRPSTTSLLANTLINGKPPNQQANTLINGKPPNQQNNNS